MPVDHMLLVMRNERLPPLARMDAAKAAAPYLHARLQSTELSVEQEINVYLAGQIEPEAADNSTS